MAIAFTNQGSSVGGSAVNPDIGSTTDATSYANSAWTPPNALIVLFVANNTPSGTANQPTVSGNSITWTAVQTDVFNNSRITLFGANGSGASNGVTTIDCAGQTQNGLVACFSSATGVDLTGGVAAAFVQAPHNQSGSDTSSTVTLAAASNSTNRPIYGVSIVQINLASTPRASWTEMDDLQISTVASLETQYRDDVFETACSSSWTGLQGYRAIAAELKADVGGGGATVVDPMGMSGFFGG